MKLVYVKIGLRVADFIKFTAVIIASETMIYSINYADKSTTEISGTATLTYENYQYENSRFATSNILSFRLAPSISYFPWQSIYLGVTTAGTFEYTKSSGFDGYSSLFGTIGAFGGKTFQLKDSLFAYGQIEIGTSFFTSGNQLYYSNNFWYIAAGGGLKLIYAPAIINLGLIYEFDRFPGDSSTTNSGTWVNSLRFGVGLGIYF